MTVINFALDILFSNTERKTHNGNSSFEIYAVGDDTRYFSIPSFVANDFKNHLFASNVSQGDTITLMVNYKSYSSDNTSISTAGVRKGGTVFLDFEDGLKGYNDNIRIPFIIGIVFLALTGGVVIVFSISIIKQINEEKAKKIAGGS